MRTHRAGCRDHDGRRPERADPDDGRRRRPVRHAPGTSCPGPAGRGRSSAALVTGALFGGAAAHFGPDIVLAPFCVFFALLVAVSVTDLSHRLVPRRLLYGALALIVPLLVASAPSTTVAQPDRCGHRRRGRLRLLLRHLVVRPTGMGFGDVRLAGAIGLTVGYLSLLHAYVAFLAGFVIGLLFGLVMMVGVVVRPQDPDPLRPVAGRRGGDRHLLGRPVAHSLFHAGS